MNHKQRRKLSLIGFLVLFLGIACTLVLYALRQNISLYYTPSQALVKPLPQSQNLRLGGFVAADSVHMDPRTLALNFQITDYQTAIPVVYHGELPNLFREKQGVVVSGHFDGQGHFIASEILAKHDENYMPKPVKELLDQQGAPHAG